MKGLKDALMNDFSIWIGTTIKIGAHGNRLHDMEVALWIKKDLGIDVGNHFAEGKIGKDNIIVRFLHAKIKIGFVGIR